MYFPDPPPTTVETPLLAVATHRQDFYCPIILKYSRGPTVGLEVDIPDVTLFHDPSVDRAAFLGPASGGRPA